MQRDLPSTHLEDRTLARGNEVVPSRWQATSNSAPRNFASEPPHGRPKARTCAGSSETTWTQKLPAELCLGCPPFGSGLLTAKDRGDVLLHGTEPELEERASLQLFGTVAYLEDLAFVTRASGRLVEL